MASRRIPYRAISHLLILAVVVSVVTLAGPVPDRVIAQAGFLETFDGAPAAPQPWQPTSWDVQTDGDGLFPMQAHHSSSCGAPPATHPISQVTDTVFVCNDHIMTSMNAGYGSVYLTPNAMVDFASGEAVVRWDMSTFRTVGRDWLDFWVTPYEDNLTRPLEDWGPAYQGEPRRGIQIRMDGGASGGTIFRGVVVRDFAAIGLPGTEWRSYEQFFAPSAQRRDTFELRISRTSVRFGMPAYNLWWIDGPIADLGWSRGIVQLAHHSYNPTKGCDESAGGADPTGLCANTWHWDNVTISPSTPFTILPGSPRRLSDTTTTQATFAAPAPSGSFLRFSGRGDNLAFSLDGGQSWQTAVRQAQEKNKGEHWSTYWTPIPPGVTSVKLRGNWNWAGAWRVQDVSIFASTAAPGPTPTPTLTPTVGPTATPTQTATPPPGQQQAITFDDRPGQNQPLNGQYPAGVIDWGTGQWWHSGPWGLFATKSASFTSGGTSRTFTFVVPRRLVSLQAYNGGGGSSTITLACAGQTTTTQTVPAGQVVTISTGWTGACTTVTVGSTNGWNTNVDALVIE